MDSPLSLFPHTNSLLSELFSAKSRSLPSTFSSLELEKKVEHFHESLVNWTVPAEDGEKVSNIELASELKERGNCHFKEGKLMQAIQLYTQSLRELSEDDEEYSIVLANRSAALDAAGLYCSAIRDIDMALNHGYPRKLHFKILNRKGHALLKLRQFKSSRQAFQRCLDMIGKSEFPTKARDQFRARVQKQMTVFNVSKTIEDIKEDEENDKTGHKESGMGRTLLSQQPLAAMSLDSSLLLCEQTLMPLVAPLPCLHGTEAIFISEEARNSAEKGCHKYEWPIYNFLNHQLSPVTRLAFRILVKVHIEEKYEDILNSENLGEFDEGKSNEIGFVAAILKRTLEKVKIHMETSKILRALIMALNQSVVVHSMRLEFEPRVVEEINFVFTKVALALYPKTNLHHVSRNNLTSANFNAIQVFNAASRQIVSFGASDDQEDWRILSEPNLFLEKIDDEKSESHFLILRCHSAPKCECSFPLKENTNKQVIICSQCGASTNVFPRLKRIQELKNAARRLRGVNLDNSRDQIPVLIGQTKQLIDGWDQIVQRPYVEIEELEKTMLKLVVMNQFIKQGRWRKRHL